MSDEKKDRSKLSESDIDDILWFLNNKNKPSGAETHNATSFSLKSPAVKAISGVDFAKLAEAENDILKIHTLYNLFSTCKDAELRMAYAKNRNWGFTGSTCFPEHYEQIPVKERFILRAAASEPERCIIDMLLNHIYGTMEDEESQEVILSYMIGSKNVHFRRAMSGYLTNKTFINIAIQNETDEEVRTILSAALKTNEAITGNKQKRYSAISEQFRGFRRNEKPLSAIEKDRLESFQRHVMEAQRNPVQSQHAHFIGHSTGLSLIDSAAKVVVLVIGSGACKAMSNLPDKHYPNAEIYYIDTDRRILDGMNGHHQLLVGQSITHGLGCGNDTEKGFAAAVDAIPQIEPLLAGKDLLVAVTCLGGGMSTGAAAFIIGKASAMGLTTVAVVTVPATFEGKRRASKADGGLHKVLHAADSVAVLPAEPAIASLLPSNTKSVIMQHFTALSFWITTTVEGIIISMTVPNNDRKIVDYKWLYETHRNINTGFALPIEGALRILTNRNIMQNTPKDTLMVFHHDDTTIQPSGMIEMQKSLLSDEMEYAAFYHESSGINAPPYVFVMNFVR